MITKIEIDGFKSFKDFEMEFTPLTVIAGANASGKSNLFDALQLLSRMAEVDLRTAFGEQRGDASELFLSYSEGKSVTEMSFAVEMLVDKKVKDNWGGEALLKYTRLRYELKIQRKKNQKGFEELFVSHERLDYIKNSKDKWIQIIPKKYRDFWLPKSDTIEKRDTPFIDTQVIDNKLSFLIHKDGITGYPRTITATEAGQSVLSDVSAIEFKHVLAAREELRSWKFLQLNPADLREPTRQEPGMSDIISHSGKNLAAALYRIHRDNEFALADIKMMMTNFVSGLTKVEIIDDAANKQYMIKVKNEDGREFSSRVLSEGTLRFLALCILFFDEEHKSVLCFEEPENGIHPYRIKNMVNLLNELGADFHDTDFPARQVIVNTHSPVVVGEFMSGLKKSNISVWFAWTNTLVTSIENHQCKFQITRMVPVKKEKQISIEFYEHEKKISLTEAQKYLSTVDFSTIQNSLIASK
jgi:predicted ATPase